MKMLLTEAAVLTRGDIDFKSLADLGHLTVCDNLNYQELYDRIADYDAVFCNKIIIDKKMIDKAKNLKYIGVCATGYNNIDIEYCKEKGITVCNAGSYSTMAVAQQTFAYILNHFSRVSAYNDFVKAGGWIKSPVFSPVITATDELCGKTIGIIGYGSIGREVAKIAEAFGMKVLVHTRTVRNPNEAEFVNLRELCSRSDIVTLHCPLNLENADLFNKDMFDAMKNGAYFINTARGGLVDEQALLCALSSGKLSGAAIDVLKTEPMAADCPLIGAENITITPHSAWVPVSTRRRLLGIITDNFKSFLNGIPQNKVN